MSSEIRVRYDRDSDVLYIATRPGTPAFSEEGLPGLMWRYSFEDGELVGLTILDFHHYWRSHMPELVHDVSQRLELPEEDAKGILNRVA